VDDVVELGVPDLVKGGGAVLVVVAVEVLVEVVVLLSLAEVVEERDWVPVLDVVPVPVELLDREGVLVGSPLADPVLVAELVLVEEAVLELESVFLDVLELLAVAEDDLLGFAVID
jgi:hypothetical protein